MTLERLARDARSVEAAWCAAWASLGDRTEERRTRAAEPRGLRERLRSLGMRSWGGLTSMTLDLEGWRPAYPTAHPDVELLRATTAEEAHDVLRVACDVFLLP